MMFGFGFHHGLGGIFMLLLLLGIGVVFALVLAKIIRSGQRGSDAPNALEILDRLYARGEISREDYLQKRDDLSKK